MMTNSAYIFGRVIITELETCQSDFQDEGIHQYAAPNIFTEINAPLADWTNK